MEREILLTPDFSSANAINVLTMAGPDQTYGALTLQGSITSDTISLTVSSINYSDSLMRLSFGAIAYEIYYKE